MLNFKEIIIHMIIYIIKGIIIDVLKFNSIHNAQIFLNIFIFIIFTELLNIWL
jgi:hypothetical protein